MFPVSSVGAALRTLPSRPRGRLGQITATPREETSSQALGGAAWGGVGRSKSELRARFLFSSTPPPRRPRPCRQPRPASAENGLSLPDGLKTGPRLPPRCSTPPQTRTHQRGINQVRGRGRWRRGANGGARPACPSPTPPTTGRFPGGCTPTGPWVGAKGDLRGGG